MVVQRISELNIKSSGFIVPITGYIEDAFIDEDLCSYTFEHQLYLYLKKEGFDRIFFVNRARRRTFYTYEAEGFKSIENKNDNNIKVIIDNQEVEFTRKEVALIRLAIKF